MLRPTLTHFKINFAVGYILRGVLRYFHPSIGNSCLLSTAFDVSGDKDLATFKTEFEHVNWLDSYTPSNLRPNTKSVVECLCSITFYVYLLEGIYQFVGTPPTIIPDFFKNSMSLFTLTANQKKTYKDNLCFFRNTICARELVKLPKKFRQIGIKAAAVKKL